MVFLNKKMKNLIYFLIYFVLISCGSSSRENSSKTIIAFGSCDHQDNNEKLWGEIISNAPDVFIWGGDIMYGDSPDTAILRSKYQKQLDNEGYKNLISIVKVTGTYDDHDYGINDGGKYFVQKNESRNLLFDFLGLEKKHEARQRDGAYHSFFFGSADKNIKILNLDTRYFRDTIIRMYDTLPNGSIQSYYQKNIEGDILGEAQWIWLANELAKSEADLNIINSSIQVISSEHRFEKWANFPVAQKRLFNLIDSIKPKATIILSGDRHIAELSKIDLPNLPYPLYDLTSSGLTHTWKNPWKEENSNRVGNLVIAKNFGIIEVDWIKKECFFNVKGANDTLLLREPLLIFN
jgi:alkaline phosphatase D